MAESEYADGKKFPAVKHIVTEGGDKIDADQQTAEADTAAATASNPAAPAALSQVAAPAGGSGATAGAYDDATNRDLMIASVNAARDDVIALRAEVITYEVAISALIVDVAALRVTVNSLLAKLRTYGILAT